MLRSSSSLQHKLLDSQTDKRRLPSSLSLLRPRFFGLAVFLILASFVLWALTYHSAIPLATSVPNKDKTKSEPKSQRLLEPSVQDLYPARVTPSYQDSAMAGKGALRSVVVQALAGKDKNTATVIFAHGLGDSGHGWTFLAEQLRPRFPYIKFIFPHAPSIPVTLNGGMRMPGWFDILTLRAPRPGDPPGQEDEAGMLNSVSNIKEIVDAEILSGMGEDRILVGGFSQGGALSYLTALTTDRKLAGIIALSAWLPMSHKATELLNAGNEGVRFFHGHGKSDQVVNYAWGDASVKSLKENLKFTNVEFKSYAGLAHSANEEELEDIAQFIWKVLPLL